MFVMFVHILDDYLQSDSDNSGDENEANGMGEKRFINSSTLSYNAHY